MTALVLKDILVQRRNLLYSILIASIMLISFQNGMGNGAYMIGAISVVYSLISGIFGYDEKNHGDMLINSFPVYRREVVRARYISLLIFILYSVVMVGLIGVVLKVSGIPVKLGFIGVSDIISILIVSLVLNSIYIPIYFKYGFMKSRIVIIFLYVVPIFAVSSIVYSIRQTVAENMSHGALTGFLTLLEKSPDPVLAMTSICLLFLILAVSYSISFKVYSNKDF